MGKMNEFIRTPGTEALLKGQSQSVVDMLYQLLDTVCII
jgi:hypothetical protein